VAHQHPLPEALAAPDAEEVGVPQCVRQAFGADLARETDPFGVAGRFAFVGEEQFGVGFGA
jgi:hypothetical protein